MAATVGLAGEAPPETEDSSALEEVPEAPTMGPLQEAWESFKIKWELGGPTMWALGALALVALVFAFDRIVGLRRSRIVPRGLADQANRLWAEGEFEQILKLARQRRSTLGEVITFLVEHRSNSYEHLNAAAEDIAARDFEQHNRSVYPLVAVGTLSPLLGLLGTVFGLLGAFATIGVVGSMDDPSALAGDIGEALITTAAGLIVAIPTLILYHYFNSRTSLYAGILGTEVSNLMHGWFLKKEGTDASQT
jgi:biopolymer transport protein ExbB